MGLAKVLKVLGVCLTSAVGGTSIAAIGMNRLLHSGTSYHGEEFMRQYLVDGLFSWTEYYVDDDCMAILKMSYIGPDSTILDLDFDDKVDRLIMEDNGLLGSGRKVVAVRNPEEDNRWIDDYFQDQLRRFR